MNKKITFSIPFSKIDEEQRMVYGVATAEVLDKQNEIVDYEASKKAFSDWSGNIREMHGEKAVGKKIDLQFDDANKAVVLGSYISKSRDGEDAWTKIKEGILTGYSIGGRVFETTDEVAKSSDGKSINAKRINSYELAETSLVDSPACPVAEFVLVKSMKGKEKELEQVEKMVEHKNAVPILGWQKLFVYSLDQHMAIQKQKEHEDSVKEFEKKDYSDKARSDMADKGEALPDGSFPIANTQDLKNAIKAIGRAKDPAKAKAHIKRRAKALGETDLIPDTWKNQETSDLAKTDTVDSEENNEQPESTQDGNASSAQGTQDGDAPSPEVDRSQVSTPALDGKAQEPESSVEGEEVNVNKPSDAENTEDESEEEKESDQEKSDKNKDLRKDLYTVSSFAECLASLTSIRDWCVMEQEWEGDDSTVPADLTKAIENLGGILQNMAKEEIDEAAENKNGTAAAPLVLSDKPSDLSKIQDTITQTTQAAIDKQAELIFGKVAELVKPLADRVASLEHQPASADRPVASYHEVEKGVGMPEAPNPTGEAQASDMARWNELRQIAQTRKNDSSFTITERQRLVDEMWKLNKKINHVETKDLDPSLPANYPYAFNRL